RTPVADTAAEAQSRHRVQSWRRCGARLLSAIAGVFVVAVLAAPAASAHASLDAADPADGSTLDAAPRQLDLHFTQAVVDALTAVSVRDGTGAPVSDVGAVVVRPGGTEVTVALPVLAPDIYRVDWHTVSKDDLHTVTGTLVFGVQRTAPAAGRLAAG